MLGRLQDKVAVVMGAGCAGEGWGNGKATAVLFAREGARVVCIDHNLESAEATVDIIRAEGGKAVAMRADVTSAEHIDRVTKDVLSDFGHIDVLQNNVGIADTVCATEAVSEASWDRVMDVNIKGIFLTCRRIMPEMARRRGGAVVNVSSLASIRIIGVPMASYYASKAAVNQFTQAVAIEYATRGVRCNAVLPGLMNTPMIVDPYKYVYQDVDDMIARRDAMVPTGKMGDAWDVAHASLFLASDDASYVTGVLLPVDGGMSCKCG
ncbi:SDR family NAD(P)-dependent oxidoreductase [Pseudochelatococcus sp. B33]